MALTQLSQSLVSTCQLATVLMRYSSYNSLMRLCHYEVPPPIAVVPCRDTIADGEVDDRQQALTTTSDHREEQPTSVFRELWSCEDVASACACDATTVWSHATISILAIGAWTVLSCFLPFSANPVHIAVVILTIASFAWVAILATSPARNLLKRWSESTAPPSLDSSIQVMAPPVSPLKSRAQQCCHFVINEGLRSGRVQGTLLLLSIGILVCLQGEYILRYTAPDNSTLIDNGVGVSVYVDNHKAKSLYGLDRSLISLDKIAFQIAILQVLVSWVFHVPLVCVLPCSLVHMLVLLCQIPSSSTELSNRREIGGVLFAALTTWFMLPVGLLIVVSYRLHRCVASDIKAAIKWSLDVTNDKSRVYATTSNDSTSGNVLPASTALAGLNTTVKFEDTHQAALGGLLSSSTNQLTPGHRRASGLRLTHKCLNSGGLANDDLGSLTIASIVLDMNGVIVDASTSFCRLCHVEDVSLLLHRSLESVLEWFDVDEVGAVVQTLRDAARAEPLKAVAATQIDLCMKFGGVSLETRWPKRVLIRGYGTAAVAVDTSGGYSPAENNDSFSPSKSSSHAHNGPEGCFAVVMDVARVRVGKPGSAVDSLQPSGVDRIVLRQPLLHASLDVLPIAAMLFQRNSGSILLWNKALRRMTNETPFDMLGANAYHDVLGTEDAPYLLPLPHHEGLPLFPHYGECKILLADVGAAKTISFALYEWPSHVHCDVLLCLFDRTVQHVGRWHHASSHSGTLGQNTSTRGRMEQYSQHVLQSLLKNVSEFTRAGQQPAQPVGAGPKQQQQHVERLEAFADSMIQLTKSLAMSQLPERSRSEERGAFRSTPVEGSTRSGTPIQFASAAGGSGAAVDLSHSLPHLVSLPHPTPIPAGAWGKLVSQDTSQCDGSIIVTPLGKEFTFGRSAKCTLIIADTFVSSVQFSIVRSQGTKGPQVTLFDHSANGTFVNVKKVGKGRTCPLRHNDLITFRLSSSRFFLGFVFQLLELEGRGVPGGNNSLNRAGSMERRVDPLALPRAASQHHFNATPAKGNDHKIAGEAATSPAVAPTQIPIKRKRQGAQPLPIEWKIGEEVLGKGGNAEVFLGINLTNGKLIAVKRVPVPKDTTTQRQYKSLQEEISMLTNAEHPNIVHYYGSSQSDTHLNILLEFVPGGSLRHLLDNFGALGDGVIFSYLDQTLRGLGYLHGRGIVHSDIKTANILVTDKGKVKLTDFGTASLLTQVQNANPTANTPPSSDSATPLQNGTGNSGGNSGGKFTVVGTLLWMAPELVKGESPATKASDIWSLGCAIVEMITAECPWSEYDFENEEQIANLLKYTTEPPEVPDTTNPLIAEMARKCLQLDPSKRPTCEELLAMLAEQRQQAPLPVTEDPGLDTSDGQVRETVSFSESHNEFPKFDSSLGPAAHQIPLEPSTSQADSVTGINSGEWEFQEVVEQLDAAQRLVHRD